MGVCVLHHCSFFVFSPPFRLLPLTSLSLLLDFVSILGERQQSDDFFKSQQQSER